MTKTTNKFRRGQRVIVRQSEYDYSLRTSVEHWRYGIVTTPAVALNRWATSKDYVRVRLDSRHEWENGQEFLLTQVEPAPDGRTEFELRKYDLHRITHDEIAALQLALEHVNHRDDVLTDDMVQKLLSRLPRLP